VLTVSTMGSGIVRASSGALSASALSFTEVNVVLAAADAAIAVNAQKVTGLASGAAPGEAVEYSQLAAYALAGTKLTGTAPIAIQGDHSDHDLSDSRTWSWAPDATVANLGFGFSGCPSVDNSGGVLTLGANTTSQTAGKSGTTWAIAGAATVAQTLGVTGTASAPRFVAASSQPTSTANATTINLATSQNAHVVLTENTTVTITNAVDGMSGDLVFTQPPSGGPYAVTLPAAGVGVEYTAADKTLRDTNTLVDQTASVRTVLHYTVNDVGRLIFSPHFNIAIP
jgi:hypothetical protein